MNPEFNPGLSTKNSGRPKLPANKLNILLSEILETEEIEIAAISRLCAIDSA